MYSFVLYLELGIKNIAINQNYIRVFAIFYEQKFLGLYALIKNLLAIMFFPHFK